MLNRICGVVTAGVMLMSVLNGAAADTVRVYVGTYTRGGESKGVYLFEMDSETGRPTEPRVAAELVNPSFVAFDPTNSFLYAVNEVNDFPGAAGKSAGGVTGFKIDAATGNLTKINSQVSVGAGPCHLSVDKTGKVVLVANYGSGSVAVLPIGKGGELGEASCFVQHTGHGLNPRRQEGPHAHSVNVDAGNKFAMVADLGLDKVLIYRLDPAAGTITPSDPPSVSLHPGAGPRHFSFHPNGKFAYNCNEMQSTVTALSYNAATGALSALGTWTTLPEGYTDEGNSTAECLCHPSGKFVYVSNRGHNSIAIFQVQSDGTLKPAGHESTQGAVPRNFGIDPSGRFLLAANQNSGTIYVFRINQETGGLTPTGDHVNVPSPVCVRFVARK